MTSVRQFLVIKEGQVKMILLRSNNLLVQDVVYNRMCMRYVHIRLHQKSLDCGKIVYSHFKPCVPFLQDLLKLPFLSV